MAITKTTVTGPILDTTGAAYTNATLVFTPSAPFGDDVADTVLAQTAIEVTPDESTGAFSVDLAPSDTVSYSVSLRIRVANDTRPYRIGLIYVPESGPVALQDLLPVYPDNIPTNAELLAALSAAVASAAASADTAQMWALSNASRTDTKAENLAASLSDGEFGFLGGYLYQKDSTATGSGSCTDDLSVPGLIPAGAITPQHFGWKESLSTSAQTAVVLRMAAYANTINAGVTAAVNDAPGPHVHFPKATYDFNDTILLTSAGLQLTSDRAEVRQNADVDLFDIRPATQVDTPDASNINDDLIWKVFVDGFYLRGAFTDPTQNVALRIGMVKDVHIGDNMQYNGFYGDIRIVGSNEPVYIGAGSHFSNNANTGTTGDGGGYMLLIEAAEVWSTSTQKNAASADTNGKYWCYPSKISVRAHEMRNGNDAKNNAIIVRAVDGLDVIGLHAVAFNGFMVSIDQQASTTPCTNMNFGLIFADGKNDVSGGIVEVLNPDFGAADYRIKMRWSGTKMNGVGDAGEVDARHIVIDSPNVEEALFHNMEFDKCKGSIWVELLQGYGIFELSNSRMTCTSGNAPTDFIKLSGTSQATFFKDVVISGNTFRTEDGLQASMPTHPITVTGAVNNVTISGNISRKGTGTINSAFDGLVSTSGKTAGTITGNYWRGGNIDPDQVLSGSESAVYSDASGNSISKGTVYWTLADGNLFMNFGVVGNMDVATLTGTDEFRFGIAGGFTQTNLTDSCDGNVVFRTMNVPPAAGTLIIPNIPAGADYINFIKYDHDGAESMVLVSDIKATTDMMRMSMRARLG